MEAILGLVLLWVSGIATIIETVVKTVAYTVATIVACIIIAPFKKLWKLLHKQ